MLHSKLPNRVFNSPCIMYANFNDGTHINLIRLIKPYANGDAYAIADATKSKLCSSGLFKNLDRARDKFNTMVQNAILETPLRDQGICQHNF